MGSAKLFVLTVDDGSHLVLTKWDGSNMGGQIEATSDVGTLTYEAFEIEFQLFCDPDYTCEMEFFGTSNTDIWNKIDWNIDCSFTVASVTVTMQLYNFTSGSYATAGNGYMSYVSSAVPNVDELKNQTITVRPNDFHDASGNWRLKIKGVKTVALPFDMKIDWAEFKTYVVVREGWFGFQDHSGSETIYSVKIQFECKSEGDDRFDFQISGDPTYYSIAGLNAGYDWREYNLTGILNTWTKINDAKILVKYIRIGQDGSNVYIRRCRLVVAYALNTFRVVSTVGDSVARAEFMRINNKQATYGSSTAYVIHHGIVRDIVQQEAEWSGGVPNCPNVYSQIVLTLPANATYYTYSLRTIFVSSALTRTITSLSPIQVKIDAAKSAWGGVWGQTLAENGTSLGTPLVSTVANKTSLFYNMSSFSSGWAHHWSELIKNNHGGGIMMTNSSNFKLYAFDKSGAATGALNATDSNSAGIQTTTIELNPICRFTVSPFTNALDISWHGAVVGFDSGISYDTIYPSSGGNKGLWVIVEYPPQVALS